MYIVSCGTFRKLGPVPAEEAGNLLEFRVQLWATIQSIIHLLQLPC